MDNGDNNELFLFDDNNDGAVDQYFEIPKPEDASSGVLDLARADEDVVRGLNIQYGAGLPAILENPNCVEESTID